MNTRSVTTTHIICNVQFVRQEVNGMARYYINEVEVKFFNITKSKGKEQITIIN